MNLPRITIVTPSFNQGKYLEQTIRSVLEQGYPNLEYIVIDGGSTDGSVDIIRRYANQLSYWHSAFDGGQADAIAQGFEMATGEIQGWLNSDDILLPNCLSTVARKFPEKGSGVALAGGLILIDEASCPISAGLPAGRRSWRDMLIFGHGVGQMSTFWSKKAFDNAGGVDKSLHYAFDYDLFIKLRRMGEFKIVNNYFAGFRRHPTQKGKTMRGFAISEAQLIRERYGQPEFVSLARNVRRFQPVRQIRNWLAWKKDKLRMSALCVEWQQRCTGPWESQGYRAGESL